MQRKTLKKLIPLKLLSLCFCLALLSPTIAYAKKSEPPKTKDYRFYKKYGHTSRAWNDAVRAGFAAYEAQNCELALKHLGEAIRAQAQDPLVYFKLAVCNEVMDSPYTALQYYELAQEKLKNLKRAHPYQQEIFENQGRLLWKGKSFKKALPLLKQASIVGTPSFGLYYMLASIYAEQAQFNGALEYYQKALTQDLSGVEPALLSQVYFEVAKTYYQNKDYRTALPLLEKAVRLNSQNQEAAKLKSQIAVLLQQDSMVEMFERLKKEQGLEETP